MGAFVLLACSGGGRIAPDAAVDANGNGADARANDIEASSGALADATDADAADVSAASDGQCAWPAYLGGDAGPNVQPCNVGRAYLNCVFPSGRACGVATSSGPVYEACVSDDPSSCPGCFAPTEGGTCTDQCAPDQYAVACGGPPRPPLLDGAPSPVVYQSAPAGCVTAGITPSGLGFACCPCL